MTAPPNKRRNGILASLKTSQSKSKQKDVNKYDDSHEQQMTSMDFMLQTIDELEDKLENIEKKIAEVKRIMKR